MGRGGGGPKRACLGQFQQFEPRFTLSPPSNTATDEHGAYAAGDTTMVSRSGGIQRLYVPN